MAETGTQGRDTRVFEIHTTEDSTRHTVSFQEENVFEQTPAKVYPMRLVPWFASHKAVVAGDGQYLVYNDGHLHWYDISATMETEIEPHTFSHLPAYGEGYVFSPPRAGWLYVRSV
ncbi:MAG: hypothetical protein MI724_06685, partial [Spirochaetales bacterium]|nr:hypothetical protein [Spirochaetales bacterium]